jgi:hypothetical protein
VAVCQRGKERGGDGRETGNQSLSEWSKPGKAERMAASRRTSERGRFPLFAEQIPAPDPDAIVAAYSRKAEDCDRMEQRFIQRAHPFWRIVARRVSIEKLAELERLRRKLAEDPA